MKHFITIVFLFTASRLAAQTAADPNAIYLAGKMDTLAESQDTIPQLYYPFNVQRQNSDIWEDLQLDYGGFNSNYTNMRFGGPLLFIDNPKNGVKGTPAVFADLDGDGVKDIVTNDYLPVFHRGLGAPNYFDSLGTTQFIVHGRFPNLGIIGATDVNGDGIPDLVCGANAELGFSKGIAIYYGSPHIADSAFRYPDDSLQNVPGNGPAVLWRLNNAAQPMLFFESTVTTPDSPRVTSYKIGVFRHLDDLAHDTVVWLSSTSNANFFNPGDSMIVPRNMYVTDITGDGIPDLLISDNVHIWIFKGTDSLGYYPLTKSRAYYAIPNPKLLDPWLRNAAIMDNFGAQMHACGDLSGSGIPYLMVGCYPDYSRGVEESWAFFYAGGKALDSLYDAEFDATTYGGFGIDTLHSVDSSGRSAVILEDGQDYLANLNSFDFLIYKGMDKLPHTTNPRWLQAVKVPPMMGLSMTAFPSIANHYTKIFIASPDAREAHMVIRNLLGQKIASRQVQIDPGDNTEYFETSDFPNGTYFAEIEANGKVSLTRFIIEH